MIEELALKNGALKTDDKPAAEKAILSAFKNDSGLAATLVKKDPMYAVHIINEYPAVKKLFLKEYIELVKQLNEYIKNLQNKNNKNVNKLREVDKKITPLLNKLRKENPNAARELEEYHPDIGDILSGKISSSPKKPTGISPYIPTPVKNINAKNIPGRNSDDKGKIGVILFDIQEQALKNDVSCGEVINEMIKRCREKGIDPKRIKFVKAQVIISPLICVDSVRTVYLIRRRDELKRTIKIDNPEKTTSSMDEIIHRGKDILSVRDEKILVDEDMGRNHSLLKIDDTYYDPTIQRYYSKARGIYEHKLPYYYVHAVEDQIRKKDREHAPVALTENTSEEKRKILLRNDVVFLLKKENSNIIVNDNYVCRDLSNFEDSSINPEHLERLDYLRRINPSAYEEKVKPIESNEKLVKNRYEWAIDNKKKIDEQDEENQRAVDAAMSPKEIKKTEEEIIKLIKKYKGADD